MPFLLVTPDPALAAKLGVPAVPFRIDASVEPEIKDEQGEVQLDVLVDAWAKTLADDDVARVRDGPILARWACEVAAMKGRDGDAEAAEHFVRLGLQFSPENLSLRSRLGLALLQEGHLAQALVEFKAVMDDPRVGFSPQLWLAAARTADQLRLHAEALRILDQYAAYLPGDDAFWDLLGHVRKNAGLGPPRVRVRAPPAAKEWKLADRNDEWKPAN
jgi:tetratricopeptide (TPR) repeat protein